MLETVGPVPSDGGGSPLMGPSQQDQAARHPDWTPFAQSPKFTKHLLYSKMT